VDRRQSNQYLTRMLNEIRKLFQQSIDAFRAEIGTREPEDEIAELLLSMRKEMVAARAALPEFETDLQRVRNDLARERDALAQCHRRARMAERIGDAETVRVANDFGARHQERIVVLEQKIAAAEAELVLRRKEVGEMTLRYKEADANRFALLAQLRRTSAGEHMRSSSSAETGSFADFDRMEERLDRDAAYVDALGELDDTPPPPSREAAKDAVEDRLRELKRRMGRPE
jgi:phage shock protein A